MNRKHSSTLSPTEIQNLKRLLGRKDGFSVAELARRIGIARTYVSRILLGKVPLSPFNALRIHNFVGYENPEASFLEGYYQGRVSPEIQLAYRQQPETLPVVQRKLDMNPLEESLLTAYRVHANELEKVFRDGNTEARVNILERLRNLYDKYRPV